MVYRSDPNLVQRGDLGTDPDRWVINDAYILLPHVIVMWQLRRAINSRLFMSASSPLLYVLN